MRQQRQLLSLEPWVLIDRDFKEESSNPLSNLRDFEMVEIEMLKLVEDAEKGRRKENGGCAVLLYQFSHNVIKICITTTSITDLPCYMKEMDGKN